MTTDCLLDYGGIYGAGTVTHHLTLYRYYKNIGQQNQSPLGLVFVAGTVQWSWGLDSDHDNSIGTGADPNMQQATVNLLADMGAQPATLKAGLLPGIPSIDNVAPSSTITSPSAGSKLQSGKIVTIKGTASDTGGMVGGVEVSVDGGNKWHPATGRASWTYSWSVATGSATENIRSRAVDDSGNLEIPTAGVSVVVTAAVCPCNIWNRTLTPTNIDAGPDNSVELGVKFKADLNGTITGIRFYRSSNNTGTHVGSLWNSSGALLASATFTNESPSGWQQVSFSTPVKITAAGVYVASYHTTVGHYSDDQGYFATSGVDNPPLHALKNGVSGFDGVYTYRSTSAFPSSGFNFSNYWVDVAFVPSAVP